MGDSSAVATAGPVRPRPPAGPRPTTGRGAAAFTWGAWALSLAAALGFVGKYGSGVPILDDFAVAPFLSADASTTVSWLWQQHNEHRIPLQKLTLLALLKVSGGDFRAGMFFSTAILGALALAMTWAAGRLRGRSSYADALFPLLLLHGGHSFNFLMCWQVAFTLPVALAGALLIVVVLRGARPTPGTALLVGAGLALLFLCGPLGLPFVLVYGLWLGYAGALGWRAGERRTALVSLGLGTTALLLVPLYFVGYEKPAGSPDSPGLGASVRTGLEFLSMGLGSVAQEGWIARGPSPALVTLSLLGVFGAAGLTAVWLRRPRERLRAAGLLAFLAGLALLALGIGWGRSCLGTFAGVQWRYVTPAVTALCCLYFVWELYGPPGVRPWLRTAFAALAAFVCLQNVHVWSQVGEHFGPIKAAFEADVRAGVPTYLLIKRHTPAVYPPDDYYFRHFLGALRRAGVAPFDRLQDDPPFQEVALPVAPAAVHQMTWESAAWHGTGPEPHLVYTLPQPRYVAGIRLTYAHTNPDGTVPVFHLHWKEGDRDEFAPARHYASPMGTGPGERTVTIWVGDTLGQFRLQPDNKPCTFQVTLLALLVPADPPADAPAPRGGNR